ncbi:hypothetical protein BD289DRAFT_487045 [Coniella lustricola]|uniref:Uncharacterized protein n=1 Tax=Coniella lustricola TaxID=2025994 RepID=A0A2T2ZT33_9PEZI|nr:hypothetical protein BD289DRAFT_487045 [Coniella lustricola]
MEDKRPRKDIEDDNIPSLQPPADQPTVKKPPRSFICRVKSGRECEHCIMSQFSDKQQMKPRFSWRRILTAEEATQLCADLISKINKDRKHLADVLSTSADDILSRWSKKGRFGSQPKREKLILSVAPDMAQSEFFVAEWHDDKQNQLVQARKASDRVKLVHPWLNVGLLKSHPDALFALLYNRTEYGPARWAYQDIQCLNPCFHRGEVDVDWADRLVIIADEEKFGTLMELSTKALHRKTAVAYPLGSLLLEAQAALLDMLRKIVDKILEGQDPTRPDRTGKWLALTAMPDFRPSGSIEGWSWFTHGALCPPAELDMQQVLVSVKARRERSEDYLLAMQGDPIVFRDAVDSVISKFDWTKKQSRVDAGALLCVQGELAAHRYIHHRLLESEVARVALIAPPDRTLDVSEAQEPPGFGDLDVAMRGLRCLVYEMLKQRTAELQILLTRVPELDGCWSLNKNAKQQNAQIAEADRHQLCIHKQLSLDSLRSEFVEWFACKVAFEPSEFVEVTHRTVLTYYKSFVGNDTASKQEKARVDTHVYMAISDVSFLCELLQKVWFLYAPATLRPEDRVTRASYWAHGPRRLVTQRELCSLAPVLHVSKSRTGRDYFGCPGHGVGSSVLDAFRAREGVALYDSSGAALPAGEAADARQALYTSRTDFWLMVAQHVGREYARASTTANEKEKYFDLLQSDCVEKASSEVKLAAQRQKRRDRRAKAFWSEVSSGNKPGNESKNKNEKKKKKKKKDDGSLETMTKPPPPPPIFVSEQHWNEFIAPMFPKTASEKKRTASWAIVVQALQAIGFQVLVCSGGLEVEFRHATFGSFLVYKPHVLLKIEAAELQQWGKRFARRCQWSRERFLVRSKEEKIQKEVLQEQVRKLDRIMDEAEMNDVDD